MEELTYTAAVEAILFSMGEAVKKKTLEQALEVGPEVVEAAIGELMSRYEDEASGIAIIELEDAVQLCTKPSCYEYLIHAAKQQKPYVLTDVMLETLSIIAYKQPVTRAQVEAIRGVSCSHAVNKLLDFGLITELGRLDAPGRPILFGTTEEFLRCFAISSKEDLPVLPAEKLEEFREEAQKEMQISLNL